MAEDDSKNRKEEKLHPISRRDFALGSMAALGASIVGAATPPLSPEAKAMKLEIADDLRDLLDIRHIGEDDIRRVIDHAEKTGENSTNPRPGYSCQNCGSMKSTSMSSMRPQRRDTAS